MSEEPGKLNIDDETDPIPVELEIEAAESAGKSEKKFLIMALVVVTCIALIHFTPLKTLTSDVAWKARISQLGIWASSVYFIVSVALIAIGIPRLLLCGLAGVLFGFKTGFFIGQFSALFGSYATFIFARWGGRDWVQKRIEKSQRLRNMLKKPSTFTIFMVRQLPIAGIVPNLILGLTPVKHRYFLLGSFLGYLLSSIMVAAIGSSLGKGFNKETLQHSMVQITAAMLGLGAISLVVWYLRKKLTTSNAK
ncbi:MAG: VTT domain-containing protein [bacterium]